MIGSVSSFLAVAVVFAVQVEQVKVPRKLLAAGQFLKTVDFTVDDDAKTLALYKRANKQILVLCESEDPGSLEVLVDLLDSTNLIYYGHGAKDLAGTLAFDRLKSVVPITHGISRDAFKTGKEERAKTKVIYKEWLTSSRTEGKIRFNKREGRFVSARTSAEDIQKHREWQATR